MENVTNFTNFEEFVAAVPQVAGQSERALTFVGIMFAIALLTQAIGTAVLFCAGMLKAPNPESDSTRLMADTVGAATIDVHAPDSDPSTATDVAPEAAEAAQAVQPTSTPEALPWVKHRPRYVVAAFSATYLLCVAAAASSLATNQLSPEHGLSWEVYTGLFSCGCVWLLAQAVLAAIRLPAGRHYGMLSFTEAMISGVCPFVSDSFDTMKDILFAFLCFAAEDAFVQALGALTLIWLVTFHIILLRDKRCQLEFASNHLAVLSLPTFSADSTDASKKAIQAKAEKVSWTKWAFSKASGMCSELLPLLYKQFTPTKRKMLLWENVPQAALAILYLALVPGGSTVVAVLNLAVPIVQVTGTFVLFKPLQRRIAPKLASKLDAALEAADGDQVVRLKDEAGLENDAGLFREICVESHLLKEISDLIQSDSTREVTRSSTDAWQNSWSFCAQWFAALSSGEWDLSGKLEGKDNLFKAMVKMVSFNLEPLRNLKLNSNQIPPSWAKELARRWSGNQTIVRLEMSENALGADGVEALARCFQPSTRLECLVLDSNSFGDKGAEALGTMLTQNRSVRELSVRRNQFGDNGAKAVALGLKSHRSLMALILDANDIADVGGEALADALDGELQTLHIQLNKLGDRGCKALEEAEQRSKTLVDLNIDDNDGEAWAAEESSLQETATLTGHRDTVGQAIRTGAATAVTCSYDRTLRVWDLMTSTCTATLTGHGSRVYALCMVDRFTVASGSQSGEVKIFDLRSGRCTATIATGHGCVSALCRWGNDQIATGGSDKTIRFWEVASGRCVCTLRGHTDFVRAVRRVTATLLASASDDGTVKTWDRRTEQCLATLKGHEGKVFALVRLSHGSVASGGRDDTIKIWCLETAACRLTLTGHTDAVWALARLGSRTLASGSKDQTIRLWNLVTGACNQVLHGHGASVRALVRMDAATLVSGDDSGVLKVWRSSEATPKEQLPNDSQK